MPNVRTLFFSLLSLCLFCSQALAQTQGAAAQAGRTTVTASAATDRVRFAAPNSVARLRLEVLSPAGDVLFESGSRGSVLDWTLSDSQGGKLADGSYLCVVTAKDAAGRLTQRLTLVEIANGVAAARAATAADLTARQAEAVGPIEAEAGATTVETESPAAALLAHDGRDGQLVTTAGDLSFRGGDFFTGRDRELMRLGSDGSLTVAGQLLPRGGIRFSDGTVLTSAAALGRASGPGAKAAKGGDGVAQPAATGTGTLNRLAKWAETGGAGALTDSAITEAGGFVGINNPTPGAALDLAGAFRATGTTVTPSGAAGDGLEMWYWTGAGGPYGVVLSFNRGTGTYKPLWLAGSYISLQQGPTERMRIAENGNVGIGTSAPAQALHVFGKGLFQFSGSASLFIVDRTDGKIASLGAGGTSATFAYDQTGIFKIESNSRANIAQGVFGVGATTRFTIDTAGNVGIGTAEPAERLDVAGNVRVNGTGNGVIFPDGTKQTTAAAGGGGGAGSSVKAMLYVDATGAITRCFNSAEPDGGASLPGCGFTVTHPGAGVYTVSFPFAVNNRFYSLAARAASTTEDPRVNTGANFDLDVNPNSLVVSTFRIDAAGNQTADASFMLVVH